ncbi:MAG: thioredoxin domain-containing protein [Phycisphaerales bacterium]
MDPTAQLHGPNELINSTSPYLLQHAHNPVRWRMWSDEAFAEAVERDVPVFLSIGYSTCYWCHVMERESFENISIARIMNDRFVCIKLDREEHPEIDEIYMAATTIMTGSGGWPMSVFLEPSKRRPFWAGTYFPPEPMYNRPSFPQVLESLSQAYKEKRDEVIQQSESLAAAVSEQVASDHEPVAVGLKHIQNAVSGLLTRFDRINGGFGGAPKFPQPVFMELLLDARPLVDEDTKSAIDQSIRMTLDRMGIGGIFDQVGGGFHRYSVDEHWLVPHFEKMLYDNGQLLNLYARAAEVYDDAFYRRITRRTAEYVLREMRDLSTDAGTTGFYSAQDAEVNRREGQNYLWTPEQVREAIVDQDDAEFVIKVYGLDAGTNFRDPHHPEEAPSNVLKLDSRPEKIAADMGMGHEEFHAKLDTLNEVLYQARQLRDQPSTDDKIVCSWNAMLVSGLTRAGVVLNERRYLEAGRHGVEFLLDTMRTSTGDLARSRREHRSEIPAGLEDHAALLIALIDVAQANNDDAMWTKIERLFITTRNEFESEPGIYHDTRENRTDLFIRPRSVHDGATPSGVGMMALVHAQMLSISPEPRWVDWAVPTLRGVSASIEHNPIGVANSTRALIAMIAHRDRIGDQYAFAGALSAEDITEPKRPVKAFVSEESITVSDDTPASFSVALEIDDGYHIVSADPGNAEAATGLIPLRVGLISGQGIAVYAQYPDGEAFGQPNDQFMVHEGRIEFEVAIEKADGIGPTPGEPILGITFQACTDTQCLAPITAQLSVQVNIE